MAIIMVICSVSSGGGGEGVRGRRAFRSMSSDGRATGTSGEGVARRRSLSSQVRRGGGRDSLDEDETGSSAFGRRMVAETG